MNFNFFVLIGLFFAKSILSRENIPPNQAVNKIENTEFIGFNRSMKLYEIDNKKRLKDPEALKRANLYKRIYRNNIVRLKNPSTNRLIPAIIHQIWLGGAPFPERMKYITKKWIDMHPGWQYKLWTDKNIRELWPLKNQRYFNYSKNLGERSDIIRYEILNKFGGWYVDVDYECFKSFDILTYCFDFVVGIEPLNISPFYTGNSIIGSRPNHPILKQCIDTIKNFRHLPFLPDRAGPTHLTRSVNAVGYLKRIMTLPVTYLYPATTCSEIENKKRLIDFLKTESFGVHYWANSWK